MEDIKITDEQQEKKLAPSPSPTHEEPIEALDTDHPQEGSLSPVEDQQPATEGEAAADKEEPTLPEDEIKKVDEGAATSPARAKTPRKKTRGPLQIKVVLLEGKNIDLEENRKATTESVVNPSHTEAQTLETDFFSVYFYDSYERNHKGHRQHLKQKIFLIPTKQLRSQYSSLEKQDLTEPWSYFYGVKFYVPDPNNSRLLKDDHSRFLYTLQLCDDIRSNKIHVDRETAIRLSALMLQGKLGDFEEETHLPGYYKQFPQFQLIPDSLKSDNYDAQIMEVHKAKAGYTPSQADTEFLNISKDLSRYGEHLFLAKTNRDDSHEDCRMVTIGNGCKGISIYYEDKEDKDKTHVPWKDIVKISYKKDKFRVIYHPPEDENGEEANGKRPRIKVKFYTGPRPQAKRIWKNAVEQHVFFHLDSTTTPSIVSNIFMRSSMRYSFKKTLPSSKKNPQPMEDKKDRSRKVIPRDLPKEEEGEEFVILQYPPLYDPETSRQQELQRVQIDFKAPDEEPDSAHRFIYRRDHTGSIEVLDSKKPEVEEEEVGERERVYSLSLVDENSKAATVSVSLQVDPPVGVNLTTGGQEGKGVPVFDSERLPVVKMGSASVVTTSTIVEHDGKQLTSGEHSQKYPLDGLGDDGEKDGNEEWAGPAVDGMEEAEQVSQFLKKENAVFKKAEDEKPPIVDVIVT